MGKIYTVVGTHARFRDNKSKFYRDGDRIVPTEQELKDFPDKFREIEKEAESADEAKETESAEDDDKKTAFVSDDIVEDLEDTEIIEVAVEVIDDGITEESDYTQEEVEAYDNTDKNKMPRNNPPNPPRRR